MFFSVSFIKAKNKKLIFNKLEPGSEKILCLLFINARTLFQEHEEFNRYLSHVAAAHVIISGDETTAVTLLRSALVHNVYIFSVFYVAYIHFSDLLVFAIIQ